jgi:Fe-S-cluster-containing dehydrogenase component
MKKWNLVIDIEKCFNCNNCTLACHDEYHGNEFPGVAHGMAKHGQSWIGIEQRETGVAPMVQVSYLPTTCNHCDKPRCMEVARDGAVVKRSDGIVIIVPEKARGQKQIVDACPYGAVHWNEERQLPQAWPFDAHLLDAGWTRTRGAQACPTQAMQVLHVDDEEMRRIAAEDGLEVLRPELGTAPRVYYRNLRRHRSVFIGGSVAVTVGGLKDCLAQADVVLRQGGKVVANARTDAYGDFRFSGLEPGSGTYTLAIAADAFVPFTREVKLEDQSVYLGAIELRPRSATAPRPVDRAAVDATPVN